MLNIPPYPDELRTFSYEIGKNRILTQGPGGNTSWKTDRYLWVKASGTFLSSAIDSEIFCPVIIDHPEVSISSNELRPSIEVFLHAYIPETFVIHVHSVSSISLGVRRYLAPSTYQFLDSFGLTFLPYITPGDGLAREIVKVRKQNRALRGLILQNHGLVLWGDSMESLYETLLTVELTFSQELSIFPNEMPDNLKLQKHLSAFKYLTPDHAVFGHLIEKTLIDNSDSWVRDLSWALWASTLNLKAEECFLLEDSETKFLQTWDKEIWRTKNGS